MSKKEIVINSMPINSHQCKTTHSACQCVLKRLSNLERQNKLIREALDKILGFKYARVMKFDELKPNTHPVDIAKEALKQIEEMEREK